MTENPAYKNWLFKIVCFSMACKLLALGSVASLISHCDTSNKASNLLETTFVNKSTSSDYFNFYVIFVDYFFKYIWVHTLKQKSDGPKLFICFKNQVERFFDTKIKTVFTTERKHRHITETTLVLVFHIAMPLNYYS